MCEVRNCALRETAETLASYPQSSGTGWSSHSRSSPHVASGAVALGQGSQQSASSQGILRHKLRLDKPIWLLTIQQLQQIKFQKASHSSCDKVDEKISANKFNVNVQNVCTNTQWLRGNWKQYSVSMNLHILIYRTLIFGWFARASQKVTKIAHGQMRTTTL